MKSLIITVFFMPCVVFSQVNYTVTITKLKAKADACDGGIPIICPLAPQDPVFNIWTNDAEANENTYCWIFDNDPEIEYNLWKDIQNVQIASENNVNTPYVSFDMSGFESDLPLGTTCNSAFGDESVIDRTFVMQYTLSTIPQDTVYTDIIDLNDIYFAEIELYWISSDAGLSNMEDKISFFVAPNPNEGLFRIHLTDDETTEFNLNIFDALGRVVFQKDFVSHKEELDLSRQHAGTYFIEVNKDGKIGRQIIIIK